MRRRDFIIALGGATLAGTRIARAQQRAMPVVGVLFDGSRAALEGPLAAFRAGLGDSGFVEGRNLAIEYRYADGHYDRLSGLAADLVGRKVGAIFAPGLTAPAAKAATATIPIVFATGVDPVRVGLVASLNRPGGNVTGAAFMANALTAKQLDMLHRIVPNAATVGFLVNPDFSDTAQQTANAQAAAKELGQALEIVTARTDKDIEPAFAALVARHAGALLVGVDPFLASERDRIAALAASHGVPAMSWQREFADAGGLASYGASVLEANRQAGVYVGRILKGARPADLPVIQPEKFDLVLNARTAKALGIEFPPTVLALADEVIE